MAIAKRHYQTALLDDQAAELEALAERLGVSISEALRRAVTVLLAVSTPAKVGVNLSQSRKDVEPEPLPEPEPRSGGDIVVYRRIHKRKPAPGAFLEVYQSSRNGLWYYQFTWRDRETNRKQAKCCGQFQTAEDCARARDATARKITAQLGILDEPMNFPQKGEVDARTGRRRTD